APPAAPCATQDRPARKRCAPGTRHPRARTRPGPATARHPPSAVGSSSPGPGHRSGPPVSIPYVPPWRVRCVTNERGGSLPEGPPTKEHRDRAASPCVSGMAPLATPWPGHRAVWVCRPARGGGRSEDLDAHVPLRSLTHIRRERPHLPQRTAHLPVERAVVHQPAQRPLASV